MLRKTIYSIFFTIAFAFCLSVDSYSQEAYSGYSPYSIYGLGDIGNGGNAYSKSMAGVGIANRNKRFVNIMNPASITERDSLSFMADFSLYGDNKIFSQNNIKSVNNVFNIGDFVISFPLWKNTAMMLGITPYSTTGFDYSFNYTDPEVLGSIGNINYSANGNGSLYKTFVGGAVTLFDRLSLGAEMDYYFGNLLKSYNTTIANASYNNIQNSTSLQARAVGAKFGLQYEQPVGSKIKIGVGAVYSTGADLKGFYEDSRFSVGSAVTDTLYHKIDTLGMGSKVRLANEIGVGISFKYDDKFMVEFDYTRSDWTNSGIEKVSGFSTKSSPFASTMSEAYRLGMEYVPNRNDIRYYFNRVTYRGGMYYKKENFMLNGHNVYSAGLTLGATFPIPSLPSNGLTVGFEIGQRGSKKNDMIREQYFNFSVGVNLYDIWFRKYQYD